MKSIDKIKDRLKVVFLQHGPGIGPITNNNFRLAKVLVAKGHAAELVGTNVNKAVFERAPHDVDVVSLDVKTTTAAFLPLIGYLNRARPDVLIASGAPMHVVAAFSSQLSKQRPCVVLRSHIETSRYLDERSVMRRKILVILMQLSHRLADYDVAISRGSADDLADVLRVRRSEVGVLYNSPIDNDVLRRAEEPVDHPWFGDRHCPVVVTAARLEPQKDLGTLVKAIARVHQKKEVRLVVLGSGHRLQPLERLSGELGLEQYIYFAGHTDNPYKYMAKADLFAFSSLYEGFANVVAEALACGCPVVSTDTPSGPAEILDGGRYGRLVPVGDAERMADAILEALDEVPDRDALRERADRFKAERIVDDLFQLLGMP